VFVERLWRTIKYEEVYLRAYDTVSDARGSVRNIVCGRSVGNLKQETHDAYQARTS
jgi:hypothetical protein